MKKYIFIIFATIMLTACNNAYEHTLKEMGLKLEAHFKAEDLNNNTVTTIELIKPISYEQLTEDKKQQEDDVFLAKILVRGKWSYMDSYRVYNIDDTLNCYFDKDVNFLRLENK